MALYYFLLLDFPICYYVAFEIIQESYVTLWSRDFSFSLNDS